MSKSSKILLVLAVSLLAISVSASYYRYVVLNDYTIKAEIDCDPLYESCFVYICDPAEEECTGVPEEDTWYYKNFFRNAKNLPGCDPYGSDTCTAFVCGENEVGCYEELCVEDPAEEVICSRPDDIIMEDSTGESITEEE